MQEVVFYHSGMAGMPAGNTNTAGGVIAVLDACLVNGINSISVTSLLQSAGTATATTASTHNFSIGDWIEIAGATPTAYNNRFKVTGKTSNTFTFAIDSGTASPASGTMSARHPAAGWTKSVAGTNIAGYRSATTSSGMGHHIQIEDNNPYSDSNVSFRTRMAVNLSAVDTATELTPVERMSKLAGSTYWVLVADPKTSYLIFGGQYMFWMGEMTPTSTTDTYAWATNRGATLTGTSEVAELPGVNFPCCGLKSAQGDVDTNNLGARILRNYAQLAGGVTGTPSVVAFNANASNAANGSSLYTSQRSFGAINAADGAVSFVPFFLAEVSGASGSLGALTLRGRLRGMLQPVGLLNSGFSTQDFATLSDSTVGGSLQSAVVSKIGHATNRAQIAFSLGPTWS